MTTGDAERRERRTLSAFLLASLLGLLLFSLHWAQPLLNCGETLRAFNGRALFAFSLAAVSLLLALLDRPRRSFWAPLALFLLGVAAALRFTSPFFC
ncbi:glucan phosphoethanolaminetransferase (alkaline phosphatase superfamily) [Deinococcus sp. HSC-46F16]|uniref:hypothetical protein n=1 Tax=Deinococcus sp. HSC-46F16 TaxID=2910968 RepID=UPI00209CF5E9|nr:hypothetical protein [Deinococcus sp. HSC-46F16]MCP2015813.1 glucan phosphoethanolaminetransferase (alkaline phosphatase superfamily) [Deinococcus sp. HSC-46F16]